MQCNLSLQIDPCKIRKILHDNIYTGSGWVEVEMELGVELELGNKRNIQRVFQGNSLTTINFYFGYNRAKIHQTTNTFRFKACI